MLSSLLFVVALVAADAHYEHHKHHRGNHSHSHYHHHALGRNHMAQYMAENFPYQAKQDWSYHYDEEWTFLDEEPERRLQDVIATEPNDPYQTVYDLMKRVFGTKNENLINYFILEMINTTKVNEDNLPKFLSKDKHSQHPIWKKAFNADVMELDNNGTNGIILRGSSTIALIVAFNWYLEEYCNTTYDWRTYSLDLNGISSNLPLPPYQKNIRSVPFSYYENVCTVSYTQAFWTWKEWETHLDWMAMQGINIPLAFTGQEYIFSKTFYKFGFTQSDLQEFFSGPGFFAWQRMGNLRGWGGPITQNCIMDQYNLQLNILARMNSFGMQPALTAFAGHVPYSIQTLYPDADVTPSPNWWGSPKEWCCDLLLNFTDPLFTQIGSEFIRQQSEYFGASHLYQCDTFNEMQPPTNSTTYLQSASQYIYNSMNMVDNESVWLMQGWLFQDHGYWKPAQVKAYVDGVPQGAMFILDLYDDVSPQYNHFESFYGQPFVWNTLHNFGGNQGLLGTLYNIAVGLPQAKKFPNSTVLGVGITMEGIWQNYIIYDATMKMAFVNEDELDLNKFVNKYALRRYGLPHSIKKPQDAQLCVTTMQKAWQQLATTVYNISHWGGVTKNLMCIQPSLKAIHSGFMPTELLYKPIIIQQVWQMFIQLTKTNIINIEKYRYDLIDITRQAISDQFNLYYQELNTSYYTKSLNDITKYGNILMELMTDLDNLLNTNKYWMLGEWIEISRSHSNDNKSEQDWWEFNARNQITLWGPDGEISNYASKTWGGLIATYHQPQWQLFINDLYDSVKNNVQFNQTAFVEKYMQNIAQPWQHDTNKYPTTPQNDTIIVACDLYKKWNTLDDTTSC